MSRFYEALLRLGKINSRLAALGAATVLPPFMLLVMPASLTKPIAAIWIMCLVMMARNANQALALRRSAERVQHVLQAAAGAFNTATNNQGIHDAFVKAATEIVGSVDGEGSASLVMIENKAWRNVVSTQSQHDGMRAEWRIQTILQTIRAGGKAEAMLGAQQTLDVAGRKVLYIPLRALNEVQGAAIVELTVPVTPTFESTFTILASHLSAALHSTALDAVVKAQQGDKRYRAIVETSRTAIFIVNRDGSPQFSSATADRILKGSGDSGNLFQAVDTRDRAAFISMVHNATVQSSQGIECRIVTDDSTEHWIEVTAADMTRDLDINGVVVTARDITAHKMIEMDMRHRVLHDELTGIGNLALLRERADLALAMRRADNSAAAMIFVDVNDFHTANETRGTDVGDEILKVLGFRIDNFVRGHDTVARIENDRFAVMIQDLQDAHGIDGVIDRLKGVLEMDIEFDEFVLSPQVRVGAVIAQPDYDVTMFLRNAEVALEEARTTPNRIAVFSESMTISAVERMDLRREIANAIQHNEFTPFYQPMINLATGETAGFEALVRWHHPERGLINPGSFIPLAEESGQIVVIGALVMYQACRQLVEWRAQRPELDLHININVSLQQLKQPNFIETVFRILDQTGLAAAALVLELTDNELSDPEMRTRLTQLREVGVGIAADDFGAGFADFSALQDLPFSVAKIDRSLLAGLDNNFQKASSQLRAVIEMAHSAGLVVAAEGIEDVAQRDLLQSMGCNEAQGYFYSRPVAAGEAQEFVTGTSATGTGVTGTGVTGTSAEAAAAQ